VQVQAGIESYDTGAIAFAQSYKSLKTEINQGAWQLWSGRDGVNVDPPEMCGHWVSDSEWRASENNSC
jgi:hypothetical protein